MIAGVLKKNDIVIYESTVFPGCTEEVCVPILEEKSGLKFNKDFFCGYSPERVSPGGPFVLFAASRTHVRSAQKILPPLRSG